MLKVSDVDSRPVQDLFVIEVSMAFLDKNDNLAKKPLIRNAHMNTKLRSRLCASGDVMPRKNNPPRAPAPGGSGSVGGFADEVIDSLHIFITNERNRNSQIARDQVERALVAKEGRNLVPIGPGMSDVNDGESTALGEYLLGFRKSQRSVVCKLLLLFAVWCVLVGINSLPRYAIGTLPY